MYSIKTTNIIAIAIAVVILGLAIWGIVLLKQCAEESTLEKDVETGKKTEKQASDEEEKTANFLGTKSLAKRLVRGKRK